jgi:hypothetical protein
MTLQLFDLVPRPHRAMLAASSALASGTCARAVASTEARIACIATALVLGACALHLMYSDVSNVVRSSTLYELIHDTFGERRDQACVRLIVLDHLLTTTASAALILHHVPTLSLAASAAMLLVAVMWRGTLFPIGSNDARAATIIRATAISGLLTMSWCGTRCLTQPFARRHRTWQKAFPKLLGLFGRLVVARETIRRRRATHALMIVSLYTLLMAGLIAAATVHATPIGIARLSLQILTVVIGLLIVFVDFGVRSRYRMEFVSALRSAASSRKVGQKIRAGAHAGKIAQFPRSCRLFGRSRL